MLQSVDLDDIAAAIGESQDDRASLSAPMSPRPRREVRLRADGSDDGDRRLAGGPSPWHSRHGPNARRRTVVPIDATLRFPSVYYFYVGPRGESAKVPDTPVTIALICDFEAPSVPCE